ncbi:hypothetical protein BLOT_015702 [Blomia tropicalis]|nr:hypothetical protein BLOT_015702 [Blomia tropicalis]
MEPKKSKADSGKDHYYNKLFSKRPDEDREQQLKTANCSLGFIPDDCSCSDRSLYCVSKGLIHLPNDMPRNVLELDLSGNRFEVIRYDMFKSERYHQLKSLILTKCQIQRIEPGAFRYLTELTYLNLIGNHISRIEDGTFGHQLKLRVLYLSHNPISQIWSSLFNNMPQLVELDLRYCNLSRIEKLTFHKLKNLELLWLQRNRIKWTDSDSFVDLIYLDTLSLAFNQLMYINDGLFYGLESLKSLSLAYNELVEIKNADLEDLVHVEKLDLRANRFKRLPAEIFFNQSVLSYIYFDDFKMCSYAPHVRVCHPTGDGISSVQHLLDNLILRIAVWIVALIACFGNAAVLIGRMLVQELNEVHSFFIKNLAFADFIMGIYLFIIAATDVRYRGEYIKHEAVWRSSWRCHFSGILSTISSEASVLILVFITADRYFSVMHPFTIKRRKMTFAIMAMSFVWIVSAAIAIAPLFINGWVDNFYGSNGVCLPLQIHENFGPGWEYSLLIFCCLNSSAFGFIAFAYMKMSMKIINSGIGLRTTQQKQDRNIARRCGFIVATDGICWLPIVTIKIFALAGLPINQDLYGWVAIFLLPVNSALNPILYTLTTKLFKQNVGRIISNRISSHYRNQRASTNACDNSNSSFVSIPLNPNPILNNPNNHNNHNNPHHDLNNSNNNNNNNHHHQNHRTLNHVLNSPVISNGKFLVPNPYYVGRGRRSFANVGRNRNGPAPRLILTGRKLVGPTPYNMGSPGYERLFKRYLERKFNPKKQFLPSWTAETKISRQTTSNHSRTDDEDDNNNKNNGSGSSSSRNKNNNSNDNDSYRKRMDEYINIMTKYSNNKKMMMNETDDQQIENLPVKSKSSYTMKNDNNCPTTSTIVHYNRNNGDDDIVSIHSYKSGKLLMEDNNYIDDNNDDNDNCGNVSDDPEIGRYNNDDNNYDRHYEHYYRNSKQPRHLSL